MKRKKPDLDGQSKVLSNYITHPRTKDWPMMSSPLPTLLVCLSYVLLVKKVIALGIYRLYCDISLIQCGL
uniref:Uncharacterized protein n=1 Tax=Megaselia scalaris TaxID=36166 RepID=T1H1N3_MEGSC